MQYLLFLLKDISEFQDLQKADVDALVKWMHDNKLTLNVDKTHFMVIASIGNLAKIDPDLSILLETYPVGRSESVKSISFHLDPNLDWNIQIKHIIRKTF